MGRVELGWSTDEDSILGEQGSKEGYTQIYKEMVEISNTYNLHGHDARR